MAGEREIGHALPIDLWNILGRIFEDTEGICVYRDKVVLEVPALSGARTLFPAFGAVCEENGWEIEKVATGRGYPVPFEVRVMKYGPWGALINYLWIDVLIGNWNC